MSKSIKTKKTAIILFNLGGPDNLFSVKPFLFNLFNDKYIITLPSFFRYFIAWIISVKREKTARKLYSQIGNKSPLLKETKKQLVSLKKKLSGRLESDFKIFICMRHWHPMSFKVVKQVEKYIPDEIILLPLYPQFSTTTSGSSIEDFKDKIDKSNLAKTVCKTICCYPKEKNFIKSHTEKIIESFKLIKNKRDYRILFSAHGLPKKIISFGDPYQWQVEATVKEVIKMLRDPALDYKITYQSRGKSLNWIGADTEDEIKLAGEQGKELVIVPITFVSEHVETQVELDIEYKKIADKHNINYIRVPALGINKVFVKSLSDIIIRANKKEGAFFSSSDFTRICPTSYSKCPCKN